MEIQIKKRAGKPSPLMKEETFENDSLWRSRMYYI